MKFIRAIQLVVAQLVGRGRQAAEPPSLMEPSNIAFTTPTLNDSIPATLPGAAVAPDCLRVHEDDWRQFEFIPAKFKSEADAELADIRVIWDQHSVPVGDSLTAFRAVHVRKRIPVALQIPMSPAELEAFIGQKARPMTFLGCDQALRHVHAFQVDNLLIYAEVQNGNLTTLGFDAVEQFSLPADFGDRLSELVRTHDLMLVHWRSRTLFESHEEVARYFGVVSEGG